MRHGLCVGGVWGLLAAAGLAMVSVSTPARADKPHVPLTPGVGVGEIYAGHSVVRVAPNTNRQMLATLNLAESIWSERVGMGPFDIQVSPQARGALDELGIRYDVLIDDVQALVDNERLRIAQQPAFAVDRDAPHDPAFYDEYKNSDQIFTYLTALANNRPEVATQFVIGQTNQGQDIPAFELSGPDAPGNARDDRPVILWQFGAHAREWVSPMTGAFHADRLIELYGQDQQVTALLDQLRIVIVPVLNVDGYDYSWTNVRLWRKNRRNNGNGTFGVDLNRNFAHEWGGTGSSGSTSSDIYRGPTPFSEPETRAMRDLMLVTYADDVVAHIDYHNYSQLILWPWGYSVVDVPEPDRTFFENLGVAMSSAMLSTNGVFYDPIQSADLYEAAGDSTDWFYNEGAMSLTIELRDTGANGFLLPANQIRPTAEEMFVGSLLFAETAGLPARASFDTLPAVVEAGQINMLPVSLTDGREQIDPATALVYTSVGGAPFQSAPLAVSAESYLATLPVVACGETIEFYLEAQTTEGSTLRSPLAGAAAPYSADALETTLAFSDDMETDTGWTVGAPGDTATSGVWTRMDPQATQAQPADDRSPSGTQAWITDGRAGSSVGTYDIDGGATTLTSPALDALGGTGDATLTYWRWYSNDQGANPASDSMQVEISGDDGATWSTLETVSDNANAWVFREFNVADFVTPTSTVRVRFVASDLNGGSIVEAGVDDLALVFRGCSVGYDPDLNGDGSLDFFDVLAYLGQFDAMDPAADLSAPFGTFDFFDVLEFLAAFDGA
ncbi:MAG: M14 family zinc carboxypeptidase [Planctomycetota bacterium]